LRAPTNWGFGAYSTLSWLEGSGLQGSGNQVDPFASVLAKARWGLPLGAPVRSCYEAGRDSFWLHRWLLAHEVENVVVDSSSIEVNRRARRAKTDRLDTSKLLALLLRGDGGERHVWRVVHVPSPEAEAHRQVTREIATVREDRKCVRNRIQALLATQGIRLALDATFVARLATAQTGDGRARPMGFRLRLEREWAHLVAIDARMVALTAARDAEIETGTDRVAAIARQLCTMRGVAETSAAVFSAELFGTRTFQNGRQIGAVMGLIPVPYRSDQRVREQGISRAGRPELRRIAHCMHERFLFSRESALSDFEFRASEAVLSARFRVGEAPPLP